MTIPKLILIEGIPGSGKTSTANFVSKKLIELGRSSKLFSEGDWDHPADYESTACLDEGEFLHLLKRFPESSDLIKRFARLEHGEWLIQYRKLQKEGGEIVTEELFSEISRFEIYELSLEKHQRILKQGWQNFSETAQQEKSTCIFECCFLQNPFTTLQAYFNLSKTEITDYLQGLAQIIKPLNPILFYLSKSDPVRTLEEIRKERPQTWADFVVEYITGHEFGMAHGLKGFEGVCQFYQERQQIELEFLHKLPFFTQVISDEQSWEARQVEISQTLQKVF